MLPHEVFDGCAPRQEELQLILDEAVVERYAKAERRLASDACSRIDRRDALWRQKHFRKEGVPYYSSVSLFRAGEKGTRSTTVTPAQPESHGDNAS